MIKKVIFFPAQLQQKAHHKVWEKPSISLTDCRTQKYWIKFNKRTPFGRRPRNGVDVAAARRQGRRQTNRHEYTPKHYRTGATAKTHTRTGVVKTEPMHDHSHRTHPATASRSNKKKASMHIWRTKEITNPMGLGLREAKPKKEHNNPIGLVTRTWKSHSKS